MKKIKNISERLDLEGYIYDFMDKFKEGYQNSKVKKQFDLSKKEARNLITELCSGADIDFKKHRFKNQAIDIRYKDKEIMISLGCRSLVGESWQFSDVGHPFMVIRKISDESVNLFGKTFIDCADLICNGIKYKKQFREALFNDKEFNE